MKYGIKYCRLNKIKEIKPHVILYRDNKTGIAWIEDGSSGCRFSVHANIDATGSIRGMKKLGYWGKKDRIVRSHGFYYNIDTYIVGDDYDDIAADACRCQACIERRERSEQ